MGFRGKEVSIMINRFEGEYFFLSNFYPAELTIGDITYHSSEAAYQSMKTDDDIIRRRFASYTAAEAKRIGRSIPLREDWEEIKFDVMKMVVSAKFDQHPELAQMLIDTGNETLIEGNWWHDNIYGNCSCEKCIIIEGQNMLGKILMEERERQTAKG